MQLQSPNYNVFQQFTLRNSAKDSFDLTMNLLHTVKLAFYRTSFESHVGRVQQIW